MNPVRAGRRVAIVSLALLLATVVALLVYGPIPQPQAYHGFADTRTLVGVKNGNDVLTNVAFLAVGVAVFAALAVVRRRGEAVEGWESRGMLVYGFGLLATTLGSTLYHLDPRDATLVWDRLPITVAFGAFVALVLGERLGPRVGARSLVPLVAVGAASVAVWAWSLSWAEGGDVRAYGGVKALSALVPIVVLSVVPEPRSTRRHLVASLALFVLASVLEAFDEPVFRLTGGIVSGHTLKHLVAAAAAACVVPWFRARRRLAASSPTASA